MKVRNDRVDRVDSLEVASVLKKAKKETLRLGGESFTLPVQGFYWVREIRESQGIWKLVREYQAKSENSMDVREKSGNFISSCGKKENDSFWE